MSVDMVTALRKRLDDRLRVIDGEQRRLTAARDALVKEPVRRGRPPRALGRAGKQVS